MTTRRNFISGTAAAACLPRIPATLAAVSRAEDRPITARAVRSGGSRMIEVGGGHRVWTKQLGNPSGPQVLTLHGGPGLPHFYLECFEDFLPQAGIGYWYYDQLGCGFSDQPQDNSLWTVERYREEVEAVRRVLGQERLILFGHSWGGMLAIEYALHYPQRVAGLVISNMSASIASYLKHLDRLRKQLPRSQQQALADFEARGDFSSPQYEKLMWGVLYHQHICRLDPWPEPVERAVRYMNQSVYGTMQGADEFHVTGNFKAWDRWKDLARIRAPTLVIGARYDTMSTDDIVHMGRLLPAGQIAICESGSHLAMYDQQGFYFDKLVSFLRTLLESPV